MSKAYLAAEGGPSAGYAGVQGLGAWPAVAPETRSTVTDNGVAEQLNGFLAGVERRALRVAEFATGSRDEALDIVQDAMLQLASRYSRRPSAEWPPLFHRILDNKIHDWQRRQSVRRRLFGWTRSSDDADGGEEDALLRVADLDTPEVVQQLKQQEAMRVLRGAVGDLPRRQREAFLLRIWEGLSVDETAKLMGCSDGSVKTHLSRALHALRGELDGVWP